MITSHQDIEMPDRAKPEPDWWEVVEPGEVVEIHTSRAFLNFLLSAGTRGVRLLSAQNNQAYIAVEGPMDDYGHPARLAFVLHAEELHGFWSAEEKRVFLARLAAKWGVTNPQYRTARKALNL